RRSRENSEVVLVVGPVVQPVDEGSDLKPLRRHLLLGQGGGLVGHEAIQPRPADSVGPRTCGSWTSAELLAVIGAAPADLDGALLRTLGLMGLRPGEARVRTVGDLRNGYL